MTRHALRRLIIWAVRVTLGLAIAGLCACGASHSPNGPSVPPPSSAKAAISAGATDLHSVLQEVHASPDGAYAVTQVSQCPGMADIASFFVTTTSANKSTVDAQRFAILDYMHTKANREAVYACVGTKFGMTTTQQHAFGKCVEPKAATAIISGGFSKDQIVANLKPVLLNGLPACYTTATGRKLTPPPAAASPSPSTSNGA